MTTAISIFFYLVTCFFCVGFGSLVCGDEVKETDAKFLIVTICGIFLIAALLQILG